MATFSDSTGRVWTVAVTVAGVKAVREATGVKLGALLNDKMKGLGELLTDPEQLANVVWVLVRGQHPNVTDEQFGAALGGDAAEDLAEAFFAAFVNFCPRSFNTDMSNSTITSTTTVYEGDYGTITLESSNFIGYDYSTAGNTGKNVGYLLDMDKIHLRQNKSPGRESFDDQGGGPRIMIEAVASLQVDNPIGLGKFAPTA